MSLGQRQFLNAFVPHLLAHVVVSSVNDLFATIRGNPFIDGLGYFVELETTEPVSGEDVAKLTEQMQFDFCQHAKAELDGPHVLGLDFHDHVETIGEDAKYYLHAMERILLAVESKFGISHLCVEFQFNFEAAKQQETKLDELLRP